MGLGPYQQVVTAVAVGLVSDMRAQLSDATAVRVVNILDRIRERMLADGTLPEKPEGDDAA